MTWQDVLQCWEFDCGQHVPPFQNAVAFEHIHVSGPVAEEIVDWCPASELEKQKSEVLQSQYGWYRDTGKGTLHTVELLWEYRDNAEVTALILLGAFLFESTRANRGNGAAMLHLLTDVVRGEFRRVEIDWWHHLSTNALPECSFVQVPTEYYGRYISMAVASSWLSLTKWKPVIVHQVIAPSSLHK